MATTAFLGSGSLLRLGDGASPEVFSTVYEVVSIGDFGQENDLVEVTHMLSGAKEYIYGLADGVEFDVVVNYKPTDPTHVSMLAAQANRLTKNMKLQLPVSPPLSFSFAALIKGWRLPLSPNEPGQMTYSLKLSGQISGPA